jgi:hypothetical protein
MGTNSILHGNADASWHTVSCDDGGTQRRRATTPVELVKQRQRQEGAVRRNERTTLTIDRAPGDSGRRCNRVLVRQIEIHMHGNVCEPSARDPSVFWSGSLPRYIICPDAVFSEFVSCPVSRVSCFVFNPGLGAGLDPTVAPQVR